MIFPADPDLFLIFHCAGWAAGSAAVDFCNMLLSSQRTNFLYDDDDDDDDNATSTNRPASLVESH